MSGLSESLLDTCEEITGFNVSLLHNSEDII